MPLFRFFASYRRRWALGVAGVLTAGLGFGWGAPLLSVPFSWLQAQEVRREAERGDAVAQYNLGELMLWGAGCPEDPAEARRWFLSAAEQEQAEACHRLGQLWERGWGGAVDRAAALRWYQAAARLGHAEAAGCAGRLLSLEGADAEALTWLHQAAAQNSGQAQFDLALMLAAETKADVGQALAWWRRAALQLDVAHVLLPDAEALVARGRAPSGAALLEQWSQAARKGTPEAEFKLALAALYGIGRTPDRAEARGRLERLATLGHAGAAYYRSLVPSGLGMGSAVRQEVSEWRRKAAEGGYGEAQVELVGEEEMTVEEALAWLRKAAAQANERHPRAWYQLGWRLQRGDARAAEEGRQWLLKAARAGDGEAALALAWPALVAQSGTQVQVGTPSPLAPEQVHWLRQAASAGLKEAQEQLADELDSQLPSFDASRSEEERARKREARLWYERAAQQGSGRGALKLGETFRDGAGVAVDAVQACRWFARAWQLGEEEGRKEIAALVEKRGAEVLPYALFLPRLQREAGQNDESALLLLGTLYREGYGLAKDAPKGIECYRRAAARGSVSAMAALGRAYAKGEGVPRNDAEAVRWFEKAYGPLGGAPLARLKLEGRGLERDVAGALRMLEAREQGGEAEAAYELGRVYEEGRGVPRDLARARGYYESAVKQGWEPAQACLLNFVRADGRLSRVDGPRWWANLQRRATSGEATAQYQFAMALEDLPVEMGRQEQVASWLEKAAAQGHPSAQYHLGERLFGGSIGDENAKRGVSLYQQAAQGGCVEAQLALAQDPRFSLSEKECFRWALAAAEQGSPAGCYQVGRCYARGEGVAASASQGIRWYEKAYEGGETLAAFGLADIYLGGGSKGQNAAKAIHWLQVSAGHGMSDAAYALGELYREGDWVARDEAQARKWYERGMALGDQASFERLKELKVVAPNAEWVGQEEH